jgi:hypothetical protein
MWKLLIILSILVLGCKKKESNEFKGNSTGTGWFIQDSSTGKDTTPVKTRPASYENMYDSFCVVGKDYWFIFDNPFEDPHHVQILDKKEGYVQYCYYPYYKGRVTFSRTCREFYELCRPKSKENKKEPH